jgi:hypothetical protein
MLDYLGSYGDSILKELFEPKQKTVSILEWVVDRSKKRGYKAIPVFNCVECKIPLVFDCNSFIVCPNCGLTSDYSLVDAYHRTPTPYKRLTHFKDWLSKSQAKHNLDFPNGLIEELKAKNFNPNYFSIRRELKKRGLFKHYEDINLILFLITGGCGFKLNSSEEELLCSYFNQITKVYNQFKSKKRKSIISYSFIIRELIKMLFTSQRQEELNLDFFVLPKDEKVQEYNSVFKKIKVFYHW